MITTTVDFLIALIKRAKTLGLPDHDLKDAKEFLDHNEFELCFDTIITQMYEYNTEIDHEFYELIKKIGNKMNLPLENYSFMMELIRR
jgi:hypothetical protein